MTDSMSINGNIFSENQKASDKILLSLGIEQMTEVWLGAAILQWCDKYENELSIFWEN